MCVCCRQQTGPLRKGYSIVTRRVQAADWLIAEVGGIAAAFPEIPSPERQEPSSASAQAFPQQQQQQQRQGRGKQKRRPAKAMPLGDFLSQTPSGPQRPLNLVAALTGNAPSAPANGYRMAAARPVQSAPAAARAPCGPTSTAGNLPTCIAMQQLLQANFLHAWPRSYRGAGADDASSLHTPPCVWGTCMRQ